MEYTSKQFVLVIQLPKLDIEFVRLVYKDIESQIITQIPFPS
jgi:hypothetical protein